MREATKSGVIEGLLLTGIGTRQSMDLLQEFVDRTSDIQTVCFDGQYSHS